MVAVVDGAFARSLIQNKNRLTLDVDVDILVHVSDGVGGVTAVVSRVLLDQIGDDDGVGRDLPPGVRLGLLDGLAVVHPGDLGYGGAPGLAADDGSLALSLVLELGLFGEEGRRCKGITRLVSYVNTHLHVHEHREDC